MNAVIRGRTLALVTGAAAVLAGCGAPPPPASLLDPDRSVQELLQDIRTRSDSIETLRAGLELVWDDPDTGEPKSCRGSLSYVRSDRLLRIRGTSAAFFTVFDLVAGAREVWLDVPREDFVVFGSREDPAWDELPLSPDALLVALLADPCPGEPCPDNATEASEEEAGTRRLVGDGWSMVLDRRTGLPLEYDRTAGQRLRVSWAEWGVRHGMAWPYEISIRVGEGRKALGVALGRIYAGKPIPEKTFRFEPEDDREILTPRDAQDRWRRIRL